MICLEDGLPGTLTSAVTPFLRGSSVAGSAGPSSAGGLILGPPCFRQAACRVPRLPRLSPHPVSSGGSVRRARSVSQAAPEPSSVTRTVASAAWQWGRGGLPCDQSGPSWKWGELASPEALGGVWGPGRKPGGLKKVAGGGVDSGQAPGNVRSEDKWRVPGRGDGVWGRVPGAARQGPAGELASLLRALDSLGGSGKQEPSGSAAFIFLQLVYGFTPGKFIVNGVVTLKHCSCVSASSLFLTVLSEAGFRQDVFRKKVQ